MREEHWDAPLHPGGTFAPTRLIQEISMLKNITTKVAAVTIAAAALTAVATAGDAFAQTSGGTFVRPSRPFLGVGPVILPGRPNPFARPGSVANPVPVHAFPDTRPAAPSSGAVPAGCTRTPSGIICP
jgi:hypothetical protein